MEGEDKNFNFSYDVKNPKGGTLLIAFDGDYAGFHIQKAPCGFHIYLGFVVIKYYWKSEEWFNRTVTIFSLKEVAKPQGVNITFEKRVDNEDT